MKPWYDFKPIDQSSSNYQLHAVVMLVMLNADIETKNKQGKLCYDYAIETECQEIQDFLRDYN